MAVVNKTDLLKKIVSLCKRRGFIYPGSEVYGGFANTYSYGPYGVELKQNIKQLWWKHFVQRHENIVGLDGPILLHPKTWDASGHTDSFSDMLIDCKSCKTRYRADHLIEDQLNIDIEGWSIEQVNDLLNEHKDTVCCTKCKAKTFTDARFFNLMFKTPMNKASGGDGEDRHAYLRPETAQAIFLDYKNVATSQRSQLPFGIAQVGKAFRNEITPGNFIFRVIEFEQMEIEYFIKESEWTETFEMWLERMQAWCVDLGLTKNVTL